MAKLDVMVRLLLFKIEATLSKNKLFGGRGSLVR